MSQQQQPALLDERVRHHYEGMPPSEQRLADLILTFPGDIADYSASELCELAKTSRAAATRFFRRLGYKDFNDARRQAREARQWGAPLYQNSPFKHSQPSESGGHEAIAQYIHCEQTNLLRTLEGVSPDILSALVSALATHSRIKVVGYRNNRFLAEYFCHQLSLLRDGVTLHPSANQSIAEELFDLNQEDLLIVFGMRRRTPILGRIIELAKQSGAPVALIADATATALASKVDWNITCDVHSTSTFDSYSSVLSILGLIISTLFSELPSTIERIRKIELAHEQLGELKQD
jgi:DNA-binding MurR/RpiR family transcriptional regulator